MGNAEIGVWGDDLRINHLVKVISTNPRPAKSPIFLRE